MHRGRTQRVMGTQYGADSRNVQPTTLLVEEPLEIRLGDQTVATTMRTPGHDFELAVGFCVSEGYLANTSVRQVRYCATGTATETKFNVVTVETELPQPEVVPRLGTISSSCGICGTDQIEELVGRLVPIQPEGGPPSVETLLALGESIGSVQELFEATGGSHAAASFDLASGRLGEIREDIGRHNAVDKVVGNLALVGDLVEPELPASSRGLWVSGRASLEMSQKAWSAGFPLLVSVSAPSTQAVAVAQRANLGLVGFARADRFTVYNWPTQWSQL